VQDLDAVVVGAGFSGLATGIGLRRAGFRRFVILEQADGVGGTWRANTYPGAACDVPSHLYSFSFEPNPRWSRAYGTQPEILAYLEHVATKYGLREHLRFGAQVTSARFDEASGTWEVTAGETYRARALVLGNGALHVPAYPAIDGLDRFDGPCFHTARWDHRVDLRGKRVAVIGTGASAAQVVPEIAPAVSQLHVFQRTAPWIVPKDDRAMTAQEIERLTRHPALHWLKRTGLYWRLEARVLALVYQPRLLDLAERETTKFIDESVRDPALRAQVQPHFRIGCKRVILSNDWYPTLQRPNVELVTEPIVRVEPDGIVTEAQKRAVDVIVLGTGFRVGEYLSAIDIRGRGGAELNETWRRSLRTYLGITVAGFPNLFLLMGPNTALGHSSMIFMIEAQARYAVQAIRALRDRGLRSIDVRADVQDTFHALLRRRLRGSAWESGCSSWYRTQGGELVLWPGFTFDYWWRTRRLDLADYDVRPSA
jgi:cation diffusion facilitator CzcD-associated flavoprotein CzcO